MRNSGNQVIYTLLSVTIALLAILVAIQVMNTLDRYARRKAETEVSLRSMPKGDRSVASAAGVSAMGPHDVWASQQHLLEVQQRLDRMMEENLTSLAAFQSNVVGHSAPDGTPMVAASNPLAVMERMRRQMHDLFGEACDSFHALPLPGDFDEGWRTLDLTPSMDLREEPQAYVISLRLPQVDQPTIYVNLDGQTLTIQVEWEVVASRGGPLGHASTRRAEQLLRRVRLPGNPALDKRATATYQDGLLQVRVPKAAETPVGDSPVRVL
jgi:HSP20 family protein